MANDTMRMTDAQLLEFAKNFGYTHTGLVPWFEFTEDQFIEVARAIERAARAHGLEEAAQACKVRSEKAGTLGRALEAMDCALAIRAIAKESGSNS